MLSAASSHILSATFCPGGNIEVRDAVKKQILLLPSWRLLAWLQIIPCGLFGVSAYFVPNSPYWLVEQGRQEDAAIALRQLRGPHYDLAAELAEMVEKKRAKVEEGRGVARTLASRAFVRPFIRWKIPFFSII